MFDFTRILPKTFDNQYHGHKLALWFFYMATVFQLFRGQHHTFATDGGAQSIATIPLDSYSSGAAATIIGVFALWGLSQLFMAFMYLIASLRYRSMIPLLYLMMIIDFVGRTFYIGMFKPIETAATAPGAAANIPLLIVFTIMLLLSVRVGKSEADR